jgi:hypothetical protein
MILLVCSHPEFSPGSGQVAFIAVLGEKNWGAHSRNALGVV